MRSRTSWLWAAALVSTAACAPKGETDPKIQQLTVGIDRDSVIRILSSGSGDSLANVYRKEAYLFNGKPMEIIFYSPDGLREGQGAAAPESTLRPIVLDVGKVSGWGWAYFDSVARVNDIRARVR